MAQYVYLYPTIEDVNPNTIALTGSKKVLIKYYSHAKTTFYAESDVGSIDQDLYVMKNGSTSIYGTEHTFENVEDKWFYFSAQDSLGNVGRLTIENPMYEYVKLTCNIENTKPDASGSMSVRCTGDYYNGTFGYQANSLEVKCRYKKAGGSWSSWISMTATLSGNSYGAYANFTIADFEYKSTYVFECQATDKLATVSSYQNPAKSTPVFHWGENDFAFEVPVTFNEGDVTIKNNLRLKGDGNYGNSIFFGDGSYAYIAEATDDALTIKANQINLDANSVCVGGGSISTLDCGTWTPYLDSAAVAAYASRYGWYNKVGQTVTVGFYVKAACRSGHQDVTIWMSGLPFTPKYPAAGGGMCSGAYMNAGWNFQCFVASESGVITTRVQACNNTSASNLSTSASGCNYPSGGGEVTLSGTITYMTNS